MSNRIFTPFPILKTQRLTLRQLEMRDENEILILRSDKEINKYLDRAFSKTIEDARNFIMKVNENVNKNDALYWAIILSDSNKFAGTICLYGFSDKNNNCEIGYELLTDFQGQGIMKEALEKVIDFAFNTIEVQKIEAVFHRDNDSSLKLLKKFNFTELIETNNIDPHLISYYLTNTIADAE